VLSLEAFDFLTYENGTPKDWISTVNVEKDGKLIVDSYPIEVNKPLKVGNIDIYQNSYSMEHSAAITSPGGEELVFVPGHTLEINGTMLLYVGNEGTGEGTAAIFEVWEGQSRIDVLFLQPGNSVGDYIIGELGSRSFTGLQAVVDPGFVPVLIGLMLLAAGLFLTYYQKLGEKQS
jgi:cytochrome c biogenesis protein ResB